MTRYQKGISVAILFIAGLIISRSPLSAGVVNPDISVLGQILTTETNDPGSENKNKPVLTLGETEIMFDSYLNPYSRGTFVFSIDKQGLSTEEACLTIFKGLPLDGLALKAGKYRLGFGKLNPAHPHTYSFIDAPRVMASMLPGDDGFNDTGVQASYMLPTTGSWASIISGDVLGGSSFHPDETKSYLGWLGHWDNSLLIGEATPIDIGISGTQGKDSVQWGTKTNVYGVDFKTKIPITPINVLTLQAEYFYNVSDILTDTTTGAFEKVERAGYYAFFDYRFATRWNGGAIFDTYQPAENKDLTNKAIKFFLGYSLMEETTLLRLAYEKFYPGGNTTVNTVEFQILFSMGPHKAHQF
jgi:hypothetical protein